MADINSIEQLDAIRSNLSGNRIVGTYNLLRDLDFDDDASYDNPANKSTYTTGNGWLPLGHWHTSYWGAVFNGNGHTISNLYMENREAAGLFGVIDVCTIRDVGLIDPSVNAATTANYTEAGTLIGGIDPSGPGGGVLGTVLIENCYSEGGTTGDDDHVGGFLGICHMYSTADVTIRNCYSTTAVSEKGTYQDGFGLGGFIGTLNVVSTGGSIIIDKCWSAGSVTSGNVAQSTGGFCGYQNSAAIISNSFWDTQTSGRSASQGSTPTGKTTAEMKTIATFATAGYSIAPEATYSGETWFMPTATSYPKLYFDYVAPAPPDPDPEPEPTPPISNYTPTPVEEKTFLYKVYDPEGVYLGLLNDVIEDPQWSQEINSVASSTNIALARNSDSTLPDVQTLTTEMEVEITTEDDEFIEGIVSTPQNIGPGTLIDYNNRIDVIAFYGSTDTITTESLEDLTTEDDQEFLTQYASPNGRRVFTGFISQIESKYGDDENTMLTVVSYGFDLDNYLIQVDDATTVAYNSTDPGTTIRSIMDIFKAQGEPEGTYTDYDEDTVDIVGFTPSYTFKANTIKEGIEKANQLAASDGLWYYYVDLGTNLLHFHERADTPHHYFVLGQHIESLNLTGTIENTTNDVLFTGGGDPPLYKRYTDTLTGRTRRGLTKLSDNRVTVEASADTLADGEISTKKAQQYKSSVAILSNVYDIESINIGDVVGFRNFGNYIDTLTLQVVGINYTPDKVELALDTLPPRPSQRLQDLKRALAQTDNANVPDTPDA